MKRLVGEGRLGHQAERPRGNEAEARVIRGVANDHHHVVPGATARLQPLAHQRRPDAAALPGRAHRHRRERHDGIGRLVAVQGDGRHHEMAHEVVRVDRHQAEIGAGPRPQALHDAALVRPTEGLQVNLADGEGVVLSFSADGYHGRRRIEVS
jgi:hypothetical protein